MTDPIATAIGRAVADELRHELDALRIAIERVAAPEQLPALLTLAQLAQQLGTSTQVLAGHSDPRVHQRYVNATTIRALPEAAVPRIDAAPAEGSGSSVPNSPGARRGGDRTRRKVPGGYPVDAIATNSNRVRGFLRVRDLHERALPVPEDRLGGCHLAEARHELPRHRDRPRRGREDGKEGPARLTAPGALFLPSSKNKTPSRPSLWAGAGKRAALARGAVEKPARTW